MTNQTPEQKARDEIDKMLVSAGWAVQSKNKVNLSAGKGVAVREYMNVPIALLNIGFGALHGIVTDARLPHRYTVAALF